MYIRLIAALAFCASAGSVELDPCSGVRSTYVDPVTNVLHECWWVCDSVIREYIEYCKAYCPEYHQCKENLLRAITTTAVQVSVPNRPSYLATASHDEAHYEVTGVTGNQYVIIIVIPIAAVIIIGLCCLVIIGCQMGKFKWVWKRREWEGDKSVSHQGVVDISDVGIQEPVKQKVDLSCSPYEPRTNEVIGRKIQVEAETDGDDISCSLTITPSSESGIGTDPSQRDSSNEGSEGQPSRMTWDELQHHPNTGGCEEALTSHSARPLPPDTAESVMPIVYSPSISQSQEGHHADPHGCSDGQPTLPGRSEQYLIVPNHDSFIHRDSESEPPNHENDPLLPSQQCNIVNENTRQAEPDDGFTSLSETESAYHSTPYPGRPRSNIEPVLGREYCSRYPSALTGSLYAIVDVEQRNAVRLVLASNQSLYNSQQPSMSPQIDQETRPKTQMTTEA